ncbi:MAG TPA: glutathione S-transferase N-terminal domain-containing protein [Myxococcota bacterium]|jgi:glutathione S-transferase|nr:glutathione S-transferase N-terminal domain-containing protein [Myxococcota bacterium]
MSVPAPARLVTIGQSHYCEKARWALERAAVPYVEDAHLPLAHWIWSVAAGGGRTVPVLVTADRRVLRDSTDILHFADALAPADRRLYPAAPAARREADELEDRFDVHLGPHTRRLAYFHLLPERALLLGLLHPTVGRIERALVRPLFGAVSFLLRRGLDITPVTADRSRGRILAVLDEVGVLLGDGRRFLAGDAFTAADLTFAALAAPMLAPPEYGAPLPRLEDLPPEMRADVERFRAHPAGAFALRLYAEHRRAAAGRNGACHFRV